MGYKIEKEGFEFKGFKLGDYMNSAKIIGFDYKYDRVAVIGEYTVGCVFLGDEDNLDDISVILKDHLHKPYKWEYIKSLNPIINLRTAIWDTTLIVQCLHCKPFEPVEKDGFELISSDSTILCKSYAYLGWGEGSYNLDTLHFNTQAEAQAYLDKLLELVELVNNPVPVVDFGKVGSYKLENMVYLNVGDVFVTLVKNGKCVAEYSKKQLPLPIIKAQLEQILDHLGVKANIVI